MQLQEILPTPEEYRAFRQRRDEIGRKFFQQAQSNLMADGEAAQVLGGIYGAIEKTMEKAKEMKQKLQGDCLEKDIKEIYG